MVVVSAPQAATPCLTVSETQILVILQGFWTVRPCSSVGRVGLLPVAYLRPHRFLVGGTIAARGHLPVFSLAGKPCLQVVFLGRDSSLVAGAHVDDSVGNLQSLPEILSSGEALRGVSTNPRAARRCTAPSSRTGEPGIFPWYPGREPRPLSGNKGLSQRNGAGSLSASSYIVHLKPEKSML